MFQSRVLGHSGSCEASRSIFTLSQSCRMHMAAYKPFIPACLQHHAVATLLQALQTPCGQAAAIMAVLPVVVVAVLCVTLGTVDLSMQHAT